MIESLIRRYCRWLCAAMVLCMAAMVAMVFSNVVLRYGFNTGITVSEELSRWLFVWMTFLGAVVALAERAHLGTDALISRLPPAARKLCFGASLVLMLFICWLVLRGAWQQMVINWTTTSAVMEVSQAYFYASGVVFAVLAAPVLLLKLWQLVTGRLDEAELQGIRESDDMPHGQPQP